MVSPLSSWRQALKVNQTVLPRRKREAHDLSASQVGAVAAAATPDVDAALRALLAPPTSGEQRIRGWIKMSEAAIRRGLASLACRWRMVSDSRTRSVVHKKHLCAHRKPVQMCAYSLLHIEKQTHVSETPALGDMVAIEKSICCIRW